MASFFLRSRPTANWSTGAKALGDKVISTSTTAFLGILFEVTTAGTSSGSEPSWNATIGSTTTDSGGVVWTTRGGAGIWQASKTYAVGDRVCRVSQTSYNSASSCVWKCTTGGTSAGSEPSWPTTITSGTTTQTDGGVTWTAIVCGTWDDANPFIAALLKDTANSTIKVAAGDKLYVSKTHAESTTPSNFTPMSIVFPGSSASPNLLICCDDTGQLSTPTAVATSGSIAVSAASAFSAMAFGGHAYVYGIAFANNCTSGGCHIQLPGNSGVASNLGLYFDHCSFTLANNTSSQFQVGGSNGTHVEIVFDNTTLIFGNSNQSLTVYSCQWLWKNTGSGAFGGSIPSSGVINTNSGSQTIGNVTFEGVDLTGVGANTLFSLQYYVGGVKFKLANCKLSASTTLIASVSDANLGFSVANIDIINCDSGATNYKVRRAAGAGSINDNTVNVRSGGASDGTTAIAWKLVSNSDAQFAFPLESFPLATWNDNSGSSKTATVEVLTDSVSALNNDDIWLEVEYLADSGDPLGGFANNAKSNILASNAAQTSSTATWTTTGITNVMKQKLQVSFTPQQKGPVTARVKLAKASATVYVDPVLSIA